MMVKSVLSSAFVALGLGSAIAFGTGHTAHVVHHPVKVVNEVKTFNDGFITSKQDDCANGSQFACQWLTHNIGPDE